MKITYNWILTRLRNIKITYNWILTQIVIRSPSYGIKLHQIIKVAYFTLDPLLCEIGCL